MNLKNLVLGVLSFLLFAPSMVVSAEPSAVERFKGRVSVLQGYDTNPRYDSGKNGDAYVQERVRLDYQRCLNSLLDWRVFAGVNNTNFYETTDRSFVYPDVGTGLVAHCLPGMDAELSYDFGYLDFINDENATYLAHDVQGAIRQSLGNKVVLRSAAGSTWKDYTDRKIWEAEGVQSGSEERSDQKYRLGPELQIEWDRQTYLNLGLWFFSNESNDLFHDYYDYDAWRLYAGVSHIWNKKISTFAKFWYEGRGYDSRPLVDSPAEVQNDDFLDISTGIFYRLRKDLSLGAVYTYYQRNSNEPSQKYSSSIASLGLYYSF